MSVGLDFIRALGVDEVYCVSVHDAFVQRQWGMENASNGDHVSEKQYFNKVKLLPDGDASFTRAMGMSCPCSCCGCGAGCRERTWRYSAIINGMMLEKLFLEEDGSNPDNSFYCDCELAVADAATMIDYLRFTYQPRAMSSRQLLCE